MVEVVSVQCSQGHDNPPGGNFCSVCGSKLGITCPSCGTLAPEGARFCANCGTPLGESVAAADVSRFLPAGLLAKLRSARAGRAMQGERRTVTMLFADLQGSTSAAERLDPEEWAEIVNGAFEHLIAPVHRYEGTLARLQGDAVLAFFGAPIAHEDDPVRALRAGLEILDGFGTYCRQVRARWGIPIAVRVGVNTGLVVVGEVGSDLRVEYTALGDAINVAARMEQTADPGTLRVTGTTRDLAGRAFEFEALGPVEVKGKSEPVRSFRVVRFVGDALIPARRPLVGRDAELAAFSGLCTRLHGGSGWIASVIAEAGVGKSALLAEIRNRTAAARSVAERFDAEGSVAWMRAASRSYDSAIPYSTIRGLLERWWGTDADPDRFATIRQAVERAGLADPDAAAFLAYVAGVEMPPAQQTFLGALEHPVRLTRASRMLVDYLAGELRRRPAVLVLEDLHWADDLSLALAEDLMNLAERLPLGLVVSMRPYRSEPTWRVHEVAQRDHHHRHSTFELQPLAADVGARLLDELLAGREVPVALREQVLHRASGNPLFIEEMARSVVDGAWTSADSPALPTSLNGLLTARLDRLDADARYLVDVGSVMGTEFPRDALEDVARMARVDEHVVGLLNKGIFAEAADGSLRFRHALLRETAYATILRRTRRRMHRQVADSLIARHPEAAEAIAMHLVDADETQAAFPYLIEAGVRATHTMALADAIRTLTLAIENTPVEADPALIVRAHQALGEAHALVPSLSDAAAAYQRLLEYGEKAHKPSASVSALNRLGFAVATLSADLEKAADYLEAARALAEQSGDELGLAEYHMNACFVASMGGQLGAAVLHDVATAEAGEKMGVDGIRLAGLVRGAANHAALLDVEAAARTTASALELAGRLGDDHSVAIVRAYASASLRYMAGDLEAVVALLEQAQPVLERFGSFYAPMNERRLAAIHLEQGDLQRALDRLASAERLARGLGHQFVVQEVQSGQALVYATVRMKDEALPLADAVGQREPDRLAGMLAGTICADLGWTSLYLGDAANAVRLFDQGIATPSIMGFVERVRTLCGRARARLEMGDAQAAAADVDEAAAFVASKGVAGFHSTISLTRGLVDAHAGRWDSAEAALLDALRAAQETGRRLEVIEALNARSRVASARGDAAAAAERRAEALAVVHGIAETITDPALRAAFQRTWGPPSAIVVKGESASSSAPTELA